MSAIDENRPHLRRLPMSTTIHSSRPLDVYWSELRRRAFRLSVALVATIGEMPFLEHLEDYRQGLQLNDRLADAHLGLALVSLAGGDGKEALKRAKKPF